jgi:hypothetical protein
MFLTYAMSAPNNGMLANTKNGPSFELKKFSFEIKKLHLVLCLAPASVSCFFYNRPA